MKNRQEMMDQIEAMIDAHKVDGVLDIIADICQQKAEHLRSNWQDENAAKSWDRDARKIANVKIEN